MQVSTERGDGRRWIVRNIVKWLCALLMFVGPWAAMGLAQERQPTELDFNIPAQPLGSALNAFAVTSGWQVGAASDLTSGVDSPGAIGHYTPEQAIQTILAGTGRHYRVDGVQMITIERASAASALPGGIESSLDGSVTQPPDQKPVKVPEIVVKDVRQRDQDTASYVAEKANTATRTDTPRFPARRPPSWGRSSWNFIDMVLTAESFRRWYLTHKWTSLICTLFLLMLCLTGLPLIFRDELTFCLGDAIEPPEQVSASAPVNLDALIQDAKARRPQDAVKFLTKDDDYPMWFVSLGDTPTAREDSAIYMYDQRAGEFLKEYPVGHGLIYVLLTLHVEMFAGLWGTLFLGAMGLVFVASVVSGIVVYGPFMRKLPFGAIRRERSPRLTWLDFHNLLGIVTVTWALVVGVTGVINTLDRPLLS